jgi:hypothetical protein
MEKSITFKYVKNMILYIVALILAIILTPIGIFFTFIKSFYKNSFKNAIKNLNSQFRTIAISIDQYGNVVCKDLFNFTLITKDSKYLFGHEDDTISKIIGYNKLNNTLSKTGIVIESILNFLDNNHSLEAIDKDV